MLSRGWVLKDLIFLIMGNWKLPWKAHQATWKVLMMRHLTNTNLTVMAARGQWSRYWLTIKSHLLHIQPNSWSITHANYIMSLKPPAFQRLLFGELPPSRNMPKLHTPPRHQATLMRLWKHAQESYYCSLYSTLHVASTYRLFAPNLNPNSNPNPSFPISCRANLSNSGGSRST